jgi:hypothetical protein
MPSQLDARDLDFFHSNDPHKLTELSTIYYDRVYDLNFRTWTFVDASLCPGFLLGMLSHRFSVGLSVFG